MAERIMIFDDDPDILLVTATILRRKGYEVSCREDCTELEKDISSFDPAIILNGQLDAIDDRFGCN